MRIIPFIFAVTEVKKIPKISLRLTGCESQQDHDMTIHRDKRYFFILEYVYIVLKVRATE